MRSRAYSEKLPALPLSSLCAGQWLRPFEPEHVSDDAHKDPAPSQVDHGQQQYDAHERKEDRRHVTHLRHRDAAAGRHVIIGDHREKNRDAHHERRGNEQAPAGATHQAGGRNGDPERTRAFLNDSPAPGRRRHDPSRLQSAHCCALSDGTSFTGIYSILSGNVCQACSPGIAEQEAHPVLLRARYRGRRFVATTRKKPGTMTWL